MKIDLLNGHDHLCQACVVLKLFNLYITQK